VGQQFDLESPGAAGDVAGAEVELAALLCGENLRGLLLDVVEGDLHDRLLYRVRREIDGEATLGFKIAAQKHIERAAEGIAGNIQHRALLLDDLAVVVGDRA